MEWFLLVSIASINILSFLFIKNNYGYMEI